jgi:hypothetical protein
MFVLSISKMHCDFLNERFWSCIVLKNKHHQTQKQNRMKKLFITALAAVTIVASSFATPEADVSKVSLKVLNKFKAEFATVDQVEWEVKKDYIKAKFTEDGLDQEAFFTQDGELIGTSKRIERADMPSVPRQALNKVVAGGQLLELIEFNSTEKGVAFYASIQKDGVKQILEISASGFVSNYKK